MKWAILFLLMFCSISSNCQSLKLTFNRLYYYDQQIEIYNDRDSMIVELTVIYKRRKNKLKKMERATIVFEEFESLRKTVYSDMSSLRINQAVFDGIFMSVSFKEFDTILNFNLYTSKSLREEDQNAFAIALFTFLDKINWSTYSKRKIKKLKKLFL